MFLNSLGYLGTTSKELYVPQGDCKVDTHLNRDCQLYAHGELTDESKVLIDIGTGYYVEKVKIIPCSVYFFMTYHSTYNIVLFVLFIILYTFLDNELAELYCTLTYHCTLLQTINEASMYFKRKVDYLTKQIEKVQPQLQEKFNMKQGKLVKIF